VANFKVPAALAGSDFEVSKMAQRNGMDDDLGLHAAFTGRVRMTHDVRAPCLRLALVCASRVRVPRLRAFAHACWRVGGLLPPRLVGRRADNDQGAEPAEPPGARVPELVDVVHLVLERLRLAAYQADGRGRRAVEQHHLHARLTGVPCGDVQIANKFSKAQNELTHERRQCEALQSDLQRIQNVCACASAHLLRLQRACMLVRYLHGETE